MAQHVYHWKHGWIPLTHEAALSKAKGNKTLAAKYVSDAHSPEAGIKSRQHVAHAVRDLPNVPSDSRDHARSQVAKAAVEHNSTDLLPSHMRAAHGPGKHVLEDASGQPLGSVEKNSGGRWSYRTQGGDRSPVYYGSKSEAEQRLKASVAGEKRGAAARAADAATAPTPTGSSITRVSDVKPGDVVHLPRNMTGKDAAPKAWSSERVTVQRVDALGNGSYLVRYTKSNGQGDVLLMTPNMAKHGLARR